MESVVLVFAVRDWLQRMAISATSRRIKMGRKLSGTITKFQAGFEDGIVIASVRKAPFAAAAKNVRMRNVQHRIILL